MIRTDSVFSVDITDIALPNDFGVAKQGGRVIFVPGAVPGDRLIIRIARESKKVLYGEIAEIDTPSSFRVTPLCPHFGTCGGCVMQHLRYDRQLDIKGNYLLETLRRIGGIDVGVVESSPVTPSPSTYAYRNKIELSFGENDRRVILGLRERLSPFEPYKARATSLSQCPVTSHAVKKIIPFFTEFAHREGLMAFNPATRKGMLKHLILRESKSTGKIMVILETRSDELPDMDELIAEITSYIPEIESIYLATSERNDDVIQFAKTKHLYGTKAIVEKIAGLTLQVYPGTFLQPNTGCAGLLYQAISDQLNLTGSETVLGLFCGSGAIEIFLSRNAKHVVGIDSNPGNITAAKENCRLNGFTNCTFYASRVEDAMKRNELPRADILVIDPPRTGLSKQGLSVVMKLNIPQFAYVSCNPATLARDLKQLCRHGYVIRRITPFDFFPHTGHLESLTILERS